MFANREDMYSNIHFHGQACAFSPKPSVFCYDYLQNSVPRKHVYQQKHASVQNNAGIRLIVSRCRHAQHVFLVRSGKNHSEVSGGHLTHLKITFPFVKFSFSFWWHFSPGDSCQNGYEFGLLSRKHTKYSNFANWMPKIYFSYLHFSLYSCISTLVRQFHP